MQGPVDDRFSATSDPTLDRSSPRAGMRKRPRTTRPAELLHFRLRAASVRRAIGLQQLRPTIASWAAAPSCVGSVCFLSLSRPWLGLGVAGLNRRRGVSRRRITAGTFPFRSSKSHGNRSRLEQQRGGSDFRHLLVRKRNLECADKQSSPLFSTLVLRP